MFAITWLLLTLAHPSNGLTQIAAGDQIAQSQPTIVISLKALICWDTPTVLDISQ